MATRSARNRAIRVASILFLIGSASLGDLYAQQGGYYLLEYTAEGIRYNTFAIDSGNGRGLMRVRYTIEKNDYLVEQRTTISRELVQMEDKSVYSLVLKGADPKFIGRQSQGYYPDVITLKRNKATGLLEPENVYSDFGTRRATGKIKNFETIAKNSKELHETLAKFLIENPVPRVDSNINPFAETTMYLVQVTNNIDQEMAANFSNNHKQVRDFFKDIYGLLKMKDFKSIAILDDDFNKNVAQLKLNFVIRQNVDIIVFYYSGHGYCPANPIPTDSTSHERWPGMILTNSNNPDEIKANTFKIKEVHDILVAKKPRLTLTFAECCNNERPDITKREQKILSPSLTAGGFSWNPKLVSDLFLKPAHLLVATSRPKEFTIYANEIDPLTDKQRGYGYFCRNFMTEFNIRASKTDPSPLSWNIILWAAAAKTAADANAKGLNQHMMMDFKP